MELLQQQAPQEQIASKESAVEVLSESTKFTISKGSSPEPTMANGFNTGPSLLKPSASEQNAISLPT